METFIGTISAFGFNFAPYQWASCNGQLLAIRQFTALFSLLGTAYGGDGVTTFGLPNLQGNVAIGQGSNGQSNYVMGQTGGSDTVTVLASNMPAHAHGLSLSFKVNNTANDTSSPANAFPASSAAATKPYAAASTSGANMTSPTITLGQSGGGSTPVSIVDPNLVLNYCISLYGIFPSRN